ncbi:MAG: hypothetical protein K2Q06_08920 [Parvularculaceae bacterium]|nr:hypothetical protein [Parvularculaceae bacterium]
MGLGARAIWSALAAAILAAGGCQSPDRAADASTVTRVVSTTSFGMCVGYCTTRLELTEAGAVLTRQGRGGRGVVALPDQVIRAPLAPGEWREIARLAEAARFEGLPPVIGCPDCADGGAESISVESGGGTKSVSFDHGAKVEGLEGLLEKAREKRAAMTPSDK